MKSTMNMNMNTNTNFKKVSTTRLTSTLLNLPLKSVKLIVVILGLLSGLNAIAAEEINIAVIDQFAAIFNTQEAKDLTDHYKIELEAERAKLVAVDNEITELEARLEKESEVMSQNEVLRLSSDIKDKQLDRNVLLQKLQNRNWKAT